MTKLKVNSKRRLVEKKTEKKGKENGIYKILPLSQKKMVLCTEERPFSKRKRNRKRGWEEWLKGFNSKEQKI